MNERELLARLEALRTALESIIQCRKTAGGDAPTMTYRPDPRTEPREYAQYVADRYRVHSASYRSRDMSVHVYRASLYALGWRGQDIETEVSLNAPEPLPPPKQRYRIVGGAVVQNR